MFSGSSVQMCCPLCVFWLRRWYADLSQKWAFQWFSKSTVLFLNEWQTGSQCRDLRPGQVSSLLLIVRTEAAGLWTSCQLVLGHELLWFRAMRTPNKGIDVLLVIISLFTSSAQQCTSQREGSGFDFGSGPSVWVSMTSLCLHRFPCRLHPTIERHACGVMLISHPKLPIGVNVCGCLSQSYVTSVMNWRLVLGCTLTSSNVSWVGSGNPCDTVQGLKGRRQMDDSFYQMEKSGRRVFDSGENIHTSIFPIEWNQWCWTCTFWYFSPDNRGQTLMWAVLSITWELTFHQCICASVHTHTGAVEKCVMMGQYQETVKEREACTLNFLVILNSTGFGPITYFLAKQYVHIIQWMICKEQGCATFFFFPIQLLVLSLICLSSQPYM